MKNNRVLHISGLLTEIELKFHIDIPEGIHTINNAFKKHNKKIFLVGGCVRDALLGIIPKDWDITTGVRPDEIKTILIESNIRNFDKGLSFGVISSIVNYTEYEISSFREDNYSDGDGRRPTSVEFSDMTGDSKRRDAKINSLYYDIEEGKIIDLVGGLDDIKNKRVTPVGNPFDRIEEDRLRSLRFIRFSNRFGSKLDNETIKAIIHFKDLPGVSNERIRDEFLKGLESAISPENYLKDYENFDLFKRLFGNISINKNYIKNLKDPILVLANLLFLNKTEISITSLSNFKATNEEKSSVKFLLNFYNKFNGFDKLTFIPDIDGKWLMNLKNEFEKSDITEEQLLKWTDIRGLNKNIVQKFISFSPNISSKDYPNIPPGPELGRALSSANAESFLKSL